MSLAENTGPGPEDPSDDEIAAWFDGKTFSADFVTRNLRDWRLILRSRRLAAPRILEIGVFEGRSALFFLNYLPGSTIVCVDPFIRGRSEIVRQNLSAVWERVRLIQSFSLPALFDLRTGGETFDLIYIDGCHERESVLLDSTLSWPLLRVGGIAMWDDYRLYKADGAAWENPHSAIDGFLLAHAGEYELLPTGGRALAVRKAVGSPSYRPLHRPPHANTHARTLRNLVRFLSRKPMA